MEWIVQNWVTVLTLAAVALLIGLAIRSLQKERKKKAACGGDCACCCGCKKQ